MSEKKLKNKGTDYPKSQSPKTPDPGKLCNKTGVTASPRYLLSSEGQIITDLTHTLLCANENHKK